MPTNVQKRQDNIEHTELGFPTHTIPYPEIGLSGPIPTDINIVRTDEVQTNIEHLEFGGSPDALPFPKAGAPGIAPTKGFDFSGLFKGSNLIWVLGGLTFLFFATKKR